MCEVATTEAEKLYIIDFTERTMSARKVEIHTKIPFIPETTTEMEVCSSRQTAFWENRGS